MSFIEKLGQIDELQHKINSYGKLPDDVLKKINYKFRLEWNYTSNSMEGNTLTKAETRSVMIGNITVHGKPIKDVLEIKGHDEVINSIMKIGKGEFNLSEKRIKEIHTGIMHEEDPEKRKMIGQWKIMPNYLFNHKNERVDFVLPAEVPDKMHQLINWMSAEKEKIARKDKEAMHPVALALKFGLDYVTIHPFYDGNGRTSRILTNLILIAYGYPPIYIKEIDRNSYYLYLGDIGYGGSPDVFYEFMAELLLRSQRLVLDAIAGKEIEELDDWEKKLQILKTHTAQDAHLQTTKTLESVREVMTKSIYPLIKKVIEKLQQFDELFAEREMSFFINQVGQGITGIVDIEKMYTENPENFNHKLTFNYDLRGYKRNGKNPFYCNTTIVWELDKYIYYTNFNNADYYEKRKKHFYNEFYNTDEINEYANECGKHVLEQIETQLKNTNRQ